MYLKICNSSENVSTRMLWKICFVLFLIISYIYIYSILSNFQIQWDRYIVWLSLASRRLYNILYLLWLYNEFFIILCNILKIAEPDCCQIIILNTCIYVSELKIVYFWVWSRTFQRTTLTSMETGAKVWNNSK